MKKFTIVTAILLAVCFAFTASPSFASMRAESANERGLNTGVTIDTDPTGGYTGDYVVIYNPSSSTDTAVSTGSLAGKIVTDLSAEILPARSEETENSSDIPYVIDVDYEMNHLVHDTELPHVEHERATYPVGSTHNFTLMGYAPGDSYEFTYEFVVLAVGAHCTVWTTTNPDYHPLDAIDETYAGIAAARFDEKFELMQAYYGDFNDTNGDGKVNLLFYNIDDGWQPGQGYVAGFFTYDDFQYNNLPIIHIDTYPGIKYTNAAGVEIDHFDDCFGTIVHEFQHCINYSETGGMATWLNESLSGSAEELCFPGSGLMERIPSWANHKFASVDEMLNPPVEYEYQSDFALHCGGSLAAWDSSQLDIYARYAEVMFFSQYLSTRYGSPSVFKRIIQNTTSDTISASFSALTAATGWSLESIWEGFFASLVANDAASGYGFVMNDGYDASQYGGVANPYSLLSPVVYTSTNAASIYGGGFITVKPVNGVFVPPTGASSTLKYVGVKIGEVGLEGISLTPASSEILLDESANLVVVRDPIGANSYEMVWASSDPSVVTVSGNRFLATATAQGPGTAVITATATDKDTGAVYTASAAIVVRNGWHYTKYVPVSTIEKGKEYMIGASYNGSVYVLMNYNPDPVGSGYSNNYYVSYSLTEYCYGIKAVVDGDGAITGLDTSTYPNAVVKNAEWLFYDSDVSGYYIIRSAYNRNYHLRIANYDNYSGLYPQDGQSYAYKWQWDEVNNRLSYDFKTNVQKYVTFVPSAGSYSNMFYAPSTPSSVQLYKKESGVIMNEDVTYYTVTFKDWDGSVLKTQQVAEGMAATAPADPVRTGWTFAGWDCAFDNIIEDTVVNATYTHNKYYLVIYYRFENNQFAAETYSAYYYYGDAYSVTSPVIEGYTASQPVVSGVMGTENTYITVVYTESASQPELLPGDVDCNGVVNFSDISVLYLFLIGDGELTEQGMANADFDGNGLVNFGDISVMYLFIIGE